jgi:hypothetical protein
MAAKCSFEESFGFKAKYVALEKNVVLKKNVGLKCCFEDMRTM